MSALFGVSHSSGTFSNNLEESKALIPVSSNSAVQMDGSVYAVADYMTAASTLLYGVAKTNNNQLVYYGTSVFAPTVITLENAYL